MKLTRRGERVVIVSALVAGVVAGVTAERWDPYSRGLDRCVRHFEDGSTRNACTGVVGHVNR